MDSSSSVKSRVGRGLPLTVATFEENARDFMSGVRSGVNGTPTFFINDVRFEGDWSNPKFFAAALMEGAAVVGGARGPG
jgi:hypothetical protein